MKPFFCLYKKIGFVKVGQKTVVQQICSQDIFLCLFRIPFFSFARTTTGGKGSEEGHVRSEKKTIIAMLRRGLLGFFLFEFFQKSFSVAGLWTGQGGWVWIFWEKAHSYVLNGDDLRAKCHCFPKRIPSKIETQLFSKLGLAA